VKNCLTLMRAGHSPSLLNPIQAQRRTCPRPNLLRTFGRSTQPLAALVSSPWAVIHLLRPRPKHIDAEPALTMHEHRGLNRPTIAEASWLVNRPGIAGDQRRWERLAASIANPKSSVLLVFCEREQKGPPSKACPVGLARKCPLRSYSVRPTGF